MTSVKVENKPVRALVQVLDSHGTVVRYEWRDVPGVELSFSGVELRNGDTLSVTTGLPDQPSAATGE